MPAREVVELRGMAHGGEAVGRLADGRAVFVGYAIPGETVHAEVVTSRASWARARLLDVVKPSPDRVTAPCPYFGPGRCGGCRLQHVAGSRQAAMVRQVVVDQLQRLGKITDPPVAETVPAGSYGYRSRARFAVDRGGRLAYRRAGSDALLPVDRCLLLDDATQALRDAAGDDWAGAAEVEIRSAPSGGAVVVHAPVSSRRRDVALPPGDVPVALASAARTTSLRGRTVLTESVAGFAFRVSPRSFFQANRAGAETLVALVREAAGVRSGDTALDLYAGVGMFARAFAADGAAVTAVESSPAAVADATHNLRDLADVVRAPAGPAVAALRDAGRRVDVAVLDPPRRGAGIALMDDLAAVVSRTIVYVACDPAALARDAAALAGAGWQLTRAVPVDQFAQTAHVEVVATFARS